MPYIVICHNIYLPPEGAPLLDADIEDGPLVDTPSEDGEAVWAEKTDGEPADDKESGVFVDTRDVDGCEASVEPEVEVVCDAWLETETVEGCETEVDPTDVDE